MDPDRAAPFAPTESEPSDHSTRPAWWRRPGWIAGAALALVVALVGSMVVFGGGQNRDTGSVAAAGAVTAGGGGATADAGSVPAGSDPATTDTAGPAGSSDSTTTTGTAGRPGGAGPSGSSTTTTTRGGPQGDGASLTLAAVRPGESVGFKAAGFKPSTKVRVELHSDPILLSTLTAGSDGAVSATLTIPTSTPVGNHHVVAAGTDNQGAPLTRSVPLAVGGDYTAPELREFSFSPTSVDTSTGPKTITVRARLTDAGVGVAGEGYTRGATEARFQSPSGQIVDAILYKLVSGDSADGIYEWTMTVPGGADQGTWTLQYVSPVDKVGNRRNLNTAALTTAGFPTAFTQTGAGDGSPPVLRELSFAPATVDTSTGPKTITVRARLTDAGVGVAGEGYTRGATEARFQSPSGGQIVDAILYKLVSGDSADGIYEWTMTVPAGAEAGTWTLQYVMPVDKVGNRANLSTAALAAAGFPTAFTQTGAGDSTAPVLREFSFTPTAVNTSTGPKTITVRARLTDAGVGVAGEGYTRGATEARFQSPSGQIVDAILYKLVSGDAHDGIYEWTMTVPAGAEEGTWTLQYVMPVDKVGNRANLNTAALAAAGFPITFEVVGT
jgi:hypothetical protein